MKVISSETVKLKQLGVLHRWHSADLGGESHMMEAISDIFKRAPEQASCDVAMLLPWGLGGWTDV